MPIKFKGVEISQNLDKWITKTASSLNVPGNVYSGDSSEANVTEAMKSLAEHFSEQSTFSINDSFKSEELFSEYGNGIISIKKNSFSTLSRAALYCLVLDRAGIKVVLAVGKDKVYCGAWIDNTSSDSGIITGDSLKELEPKLYENGGSLILFDLDSLNDNDDAPKLENVSFVIDFDAFKSTDGPNIYKLSMNTESASDDIAIFDEAECESSLYTSYNRKRTEEYTPRIENRYDTEHWFSSDMDWSNRKVSNTLLSETEEDIISVETQTADQGNAMAMDFALQKLREKNKTLILCDEETAQNVYDRLKSSDFGNYVALCEEDFRYEKSESEHTAVHDIEEKNKTSENFKKEACFQAKLSEKYNGSDISNRAIFDRGLSLGKPENVPDEFKIGEAFIGTDVLDAIDKYRAFFEALNSNYEIIGMTDDDIKKIREYIEEEEEYCQNRTDALNKLADVIRKYESINPDGDVEKYRQVVSRYIKLTEELAQNTDPAPESELNPSYTDYCVYANNVIDFASQERNLGISNLFDELEKLEVDDLKKHINTIIDNDGRVGILTMDSRVKNAKSYFKNLLRTLNLEKETNKNSLWKQFVRVWNGESVIDDTSSEENASSKYLLKAVRCYLEMKDKEDNTFKINEEEISKITFKEVYGFFGADLNEKVVKVCLQIIEAYNSLSTPYPALGEGIRNRNVDHELIERSKEEKSCRNKMIDHKKKATEIFKNTSMIETGAEQEIFYEQLQKYKEYIKVYEDYQQFCSTLKNAGFPLVAGKDEAKYYIAFTDNLKKIWYKSNMEFLCKSYKINDITYKPKEKRYVSINDKMCKLAAKEIKSELTDTPYIYVSDIKHVELSESFDYLLVCGADHITDAIQNVVVRSKKMLIFYSDDTSMDSVAQHCKNHNLPLIKCKDYSDSRRIIK